MQGGGEALDTSRGEGRGSKGTTQETRTAGDIALMIVQQLESTVSQ